MKCPGCEGNHRLPECPEFLKMRVSDKWDAVKKAKVCFKCLSLKHRKENCRKPPCKTCKRWHHDLLHVFKEVEQSAESVNTIRNSRALLKMIQVEVCGPKGNKKVMALLDEGSTVTLLHEKIADAIGARGPQEELTVDTVGGGQLQHQKSMKIDLELRGIKQHSRGKLKEVRTVKELNLTPQHLDKRRLKRYKHLSKIIDDVYYEAEKPMLLIGQDNWEYIVSLQVRRGKRGQPVASRTRLGWVLHGNDSNHVSPGNYVNTCAHLNIVEELDKPVKEHFTIESLGKHPKRPSTDTEEQGTRTLQETNRFTGIKKKLQEDSQLKREYSTQIMNLLRCQYANEVLTVCTSPKKWYLPNPLKKKLRIVFDTAVKTTEWSFNDALLPGPNLLQSLFEILLRFREGPVAIIADIRGMILRVKIKEKDRDSARFLGTNNEKTLNLRWQTRGVASGMKTPTKKDVTRAVSTFGGDVTDGEKNTQEDFTRYKAQLENKSRLKTSGWLGAYHQHAPKGSFTHSRTPVRQPTPQWSIGERATQADKAEEEAQTYFVIGRSRGAALIGSFAEMKRVGKDSWKMVQLLAQHLWRRWLRKNMNKAPGDNLKVEGAVIIVDRILPQCKWPRGQRRIQNPTEEHESSTRQREARHQPSSRIVLLVPATESPPQKDGALPHEGENVGDLTTSRKNK
ncbi:unnamed protein product [Leptosia nina]|uniref:Peptidase A2 domain-containing protein n=1 Tax=Leptosia nina TaxID=320188 RepID=A0AAV1J5K1_9NEOP